MVQIININWNHCCLLYNGKSAGIVDPSWIGKFDFVGTTVLTHKLYATIFNMSVNLLRSVTFSSEIAFSDQCRFSEIKENVKVFIHNP